MFLVFNKEKISSYLILLSTVLILFGMAFEIKSNDAIETSTSTNQLIICNEYNAENYIKP